MSFEYVAYYVAMVTYLVLFGSIALTLRRMQRALTRIADKLEAPSAIAGAPPKPASNAALGDFIDGGEQAG